MRATRRNAHVARTLPASSSDSYLLSTGSLPGRSILRARERVNRSPPQPHRGVEQERLERELGRPDQRRVDPEHRGDDPDDVARRRQRPTVQLGADGGRHIWMDPAEHTTENDKLRIQHVDETRQPDAEPAADAVEGAERRRRTRPSLAENGLDLARAAIGRMAGEAEQGPLANLGLPAAGRSAAAGRPIRVDREMADLTAIPGDTGERPSVDNDPAADADLTGDEHDVVVASGGTSPELGQCPEVGLVGDRDRPVRVEGP